MKYVNILQYLQVTVCICIVFRFDLTIQLVFSKSVCIRIHISTIVSPMAYPFTNVASTTCFLIIGFITTVQFFGHFSEVLIRYFSRAAYVALSKVGGLPGFNKLNKLLMSG